VLERRTIWVDQEVLPDGRTLSDTAVGLVVEANHPVLAERAMWWPGSAGTWYEAHASAGRTESCSHWVVAEGEWRNGVETYVMVANTSDTDVALRVAALPESGAPLATSLSVPTETRRNVSVPDMFPSLLGQRFGMRLEPAPGEPPRRSWWNGRCMPTADRSGGRPGPRRRARVGLRQTRRRDPVARPPR
jgi:hypothetical protein